MQTENLNYEPLIYQTQDVQEASLLKALDQKFTVKNGQKTVVFQFDELEQCETILNQYINDELIINPRDLFNAMHDIKKIVISYKTRNESN